MLEMKTPSPTTKGVEMAMDEVEVAWAEADVKVGVEELVKEDADKTNRSHGIQEYRMDVVLSDCSAKFYT